jgi:hypothetical protein
MRWSRSLCALVMLGVSGPALAEQGNDAPAVTVLRGASAPPPVVSTPPVAAAEPQVVVQTVVYPEVVYVPTYYPAYTFYPGYFIQPRHVIRQPQPMTVQPGITGSLRSIR